MARRRAPTSIRRTQEAKGIDFLDDVFSREGVLTPKLKKTSKGGSF